MSRVRGVAVVVPARDEERLLPACLDALLAAADDLREERQVPVDVSVVLDSCTDRSAEVVAARPAVRAVPVQAGQVGRARAAGFADVLARWSERDPAGLWLATTDADSVVPRDWLVRQLEHADAGADLVLGTVEVHDWSEHPRHVEARWRATYRPYDGHSHVHGANVGFGADAYLAVGGFRHLDRDEDVTLAAALSGRRVVRTAAIPVVTSARSVARARGGFADHLRGLLGQDDQGTGSTALEFT